MRMLFRFSLFFLIAVLGFVSQACFARNQEFQRPNTFIGNAGWSGALEIWVECGEMALGKGEAIPLRFQFVSDGKEFGGGFDLGWWCPFFEGRTITRDGNLYVSTLGGDWRFLKSNSNGGFSSMDGKSTATANGDKVDLSENGWHYEYAQGWIVAATSPQGTRLEWQYADNQLSAIRKDGLGWLDIERSNHGLLARWDGMVLRFSKEIRPGGWVWNITPPTGISRTFEVRQNLGVTEMRASSGKLPISKFVWESNSGHLLSDSDFTYKMQPTDLGKQILHRLDQQGGSEWYDYDRNQGLAIYKRQDGCQVQTWYHLEAGPTYRKPFQMDTFTSDYRLISSRRLIYSKEGDIEKEWTEPGEAVFEADGAVQFVGEKEAIRLHGEKGVLFVDARKQWEFERGRIPGAVLLSREHFEENFPELEKQLRSADKLVIYCTSRNCEDSSLVATRLAQLGFPCVLVFEGGWAEWWKRHR